MCDAPALAVVPLPEAGCSKEPPPKQEVTGPQAVTIVFRLAFGILVTMVLLPLLDALLYRVPT